MTKFSQTECKRRHGCTSDLLRQGVNMSVLHLPREMGQGQHRWGPSQGTLKDQGRINACLWKEPRGPPPPTQQFTSRGFYVLREPRRCWLPVTAAWLWTWIPLLGWQLEPVRLQWWHQLRAFLRCFLKCCTAEGALKDSSWKSRG